MDSNLVINRFDYTYLPKPTALDIPYPKTFYEYHFDGIVEINGKSEECILFFNAGNGLINRKQISISYNKNGVFYLLPEETISLQALAETKAILLAVKNIPSILKEIVLGNKLNYIQCGNKDAYNLQKILLQQKNIQTDSIFQASRELYAFCMSLCEIANEKPKPYSLLVQHAIQTMEDQLSYIESIHELSEILGVSQGHLIRSFKMETGISPGKYLQIIRIESAKLLLRNRLYSVETIANLVGYSGANYFGKVFLKLTGQSPGKYRKFNAFSQCEEDESRLQKIEEIYYY